MTAADEIALAEATERLRQIKETFDQHKSQNEREFRVRLAMAWVAVVILPSILVIAAVIVFDHARFGEAVVVAATSALLVDGLATAFSLYKLVIGGGLEHQLAPVDTSA